MRTPLLSQHLAPYPCRRCGVIVRTVTTVEGSLLTITNEPSPNGNIIPWPSDSPNGLAVARVLTHPIDDGPMWEEHSCG